MHSHTIPFGPQHPGLKEPACLKLRLEGNYIKEADISLGYIHRGLEKLLEGKDVNKTANIVERVCGLCGGAYSLCFARGIENSAGIAISERARLIRTIIAEIERLHSHLLWASFTAHEIGYETLFMFFMRERERILEISEMITGSRIHRAAIRIGGVRYDVNQRDESYILDRLGPVEKNISNYLKTIKTDPVIKARLKDVGYISKKEAISHCLVGPTARGSGVNNDIRQVQPYAAYPDLKFNVMLEDGGDALSRMVVRLREIIESIKIIRNALKELRKEKPLPTRARPKLVLTDVTKKIETISRVEAPRGELFQFISFKDGKAQRIRLRPPTLANILILQKILADRELGDVPVIVGSIDPCFACMERVMLVRDNKMEIMNEERFRKCMKSL